MNYLKKGFIHMKINYYDATMIRYKEKLTKYLQSYQSSLRHSLMTAGGKTDLKELYWVMLQILKPFYGVAAGKSFSQWRYKKYYS